MKFGRRGVFLVLGAIFGALLLALLAWRYREYLDREHVEWAVEQFRRMGPIVYFGAMSILPLFWFPLSPFLFLASAFGTTTAIVGSLLALSINMTLAWLVSGKWFRPFFERLVARFGYSIPVLPERSVVGVILLLRITPGVPFPLQNYLLGLARVPFGKFMAVSVPANAAVSISLILFGDAILKGSAGMAFIAVAVFVAVAIGIKMLRSHLQAKAITEGSNGST